MTETSNTESGLTGMTTRITEAFVANNTLPPDQVSMLIRDVHKSLKQIDEGAQTETSGAGREPAVPVKQAVKRDHVVCLECGKKLQVLKRHLNTEHGLTPPEYRERWGLSSAFPLVAPDYAAKRSRLAKDIGLGNQGKPS